MTEMKRTNNREFASETAGSQSNRRKQAAGSPSTRAFKITIIAIMTVLMLAYYMGPQVHAAGNVSFKGETEGFTFSPGSSGSDTDLFPDFKNVMPGDTVQDTVKVENKSGDTVKIYMRALDPEEEGKDFLNQLEMEVAAQGGSELFKATADKKAGLADWVLLGEMATGGSATLEVSVSVPLSMGNEYQEAAGAVNWQFMAEDVTEDEDDPNDPDDGDDQDDPDDPDDGGDTDDGDDPDDSIDDPDDSIDDPEDGDDPGDNGDDGSKKSGNSTTGDNSSVVLWIGILAAALVIALVLVLVRRSRRNKE